MKLRDVRTELRALGFVRRAGKGSHEIWTDPMQPGRRVVLYGRGSDELHKYQATLLRKLKRGKSVDCGRER